MVLPAVGDRHRELAANPLTEKSVTGLCNDGILRLFSQFGNQRAHEAVVPRRLGLTVRNSPRGFQHLAPPRSGSRSDQARAAISRPARSDFSRLPVVACFALGPAHLGIVPNYLPDSAFARLLQSPQQCARGNS